MKDILPIIQIAVAIFLIVFILLQQRGAGMGSAFGGGGGGDASYGTRRGIEKKLFWGAVILGSLFILLSLLNLIL